MDLKTPSYYRVFTASIGYHKLAARYGVSRSTSTNGCRTAGYSIADTLH
ncbi:MAG: hypothetical protein H0W75_12510 [Chitinophagaceae bacterium]|nr:hypothetical protein [Chitinophagaceae bacterium]